MSRHSASVRAVLATPDGPILVDPPQGPVTGVLDRGVTAGSAAASTLAGAAHSAWDSTRSAATGAVLPALGSAAATGSAAASHALGVAREAAKEVVGDIVREAGPTAAEVWERARSSGPAQQLAARSDLVAGVVGPPRKRRRRWPLLGALALGLTAGIAVARRRAASAATPPAAPAAHGNVGGVNPAVPTTEPIPATGARVAPGRPATTTAVGGSDSPRPLGQPLSGGVDPVTDGGAGSAAGPAGPGGVPLAPTPVRGPVTELPAATSATPDGELTTEG